jgi:hypothetical protein
MQRNTQGYGRRPFGVGMLIAGLFFNFFLIVPIAIQATTSMEHTYIAVTRTLR